MSEVAAVFMPGIVSRDCDDDRTRRGVPIMSANPMSRDELEGHLFTLYQDLWMLEAASGEEAEPRNVGWQLVVRPVVAHASLLAVALKRRMGPPQSAAFGDLAEAITNLIDESIPFGDAFNAMTTAYAKAKATIPSHDARPYVLGSTDRVPR